VVSILDGVFGKPSPAKFAQLMTRALQDAGVVDPIEFDEGSFLLRIGQNNVVNLRNYYDEYCALPRGSRKEYLAQMAVTAGTPTDLPERLEEVREALVPRIRERAYYELLPMHYARDLPEADPKKLPSFRPFADHLAIGVAADFPDRISEVSAELLETWGVSLEEALEIGRENLWKRSAGKWEALADGVWLSPWRDNLDVCRLALPTLFRQLTVDGDPVAFAPNRDHLIVTGSRDFVGQGVAAAFAIGLLDEPRPMNGTPIELDGLEWKPYQFGPDHPVWPLLQRLHIRSQIEDYSTQKALLDEKHEREETDIFVASYQGLEKQETKELRSMCTLTKTVDTLLPKAEWVVFMDVDLPKDKSFLGEARWERVVEVLGGRMVRQEGMYPERYRVQEFPTPEEIRALKLK